MKKRQGARFLRLALWLCVFGALGWLITAPHQRHAQSGQGNPDISVAVQQPAAEPEPAVLPSPPLGANTLQAPSPVTGTGDEKTLAGSRPPAMAPSPLVVHRVGSAPAIAIVIDDVGLDLRGSRQAIALPAAVTLSYMPYATRLREQTREAQVQGHELLLHMPMEPMGHDDPGPDALLVGLPPAELQQRFTTALASFTGFDGVNNHMGSKFTADADGMALVMGELQPRHLFFLDSRTSAQSVGLTTAQRFGVPTIARDVFLDDDMTAAAVRRQLEQTEKLASRKGYAVAIGHPHPATLQALADWLPQAQARGFVFVPLHDLVAGDGNR